MWTHGRVESRVMTANLSFRYVATVLWKLRRLHLQNWFCLQLNFSLLLPCRWIHPWNASSNSAGNGKGKESGAMEREVLWGLLWTKVRNYLICPVLSVYYTGSRACFCFAEKVQHKVLERCRFYVVNCSGHCPRKSLLALAETQQKFVAHLFCFQVNFTCFPSPIFTFSYYSQ